MQVNRKALGCMWTQTVWGTAIAMAGIGGLIIYSITRGEPDPDAVMFLSLVLLGMPGLLAICYFIKRGIERLAD